MGEEHEADVRALTGVLYGANSTCTRVDARMVIDFLLKRGWRRPLTDEQAQAIMGARIFDFGYHIFDPKLNISPAQAAHVVRTMMDYGWRPVSADAAVVPRVLTPEMEDTLQNAIEDWDGGRISFPGIWTAALAAAEAGDG